MRNTDPGTPELDPIETASRDEIAHLQLLRLRATLRRVYERVAHYREAFDAAGVHPDDLQQLSDLSRFPFTVKEDLRRHYPFGLLAVPREELSRIHCSSGTTGRPTVVGYTREDVETWTRLMARSIRAAGGRPGDLVHIAYGYGLFTGGLGAHYGAERLGCTVVPMSGGQTERQAQLIRDFAPDVIMATPSYLQVIVEELIRQGVDPKRCSLRLAILGAEPWTEGMRRDIESKTALDALDIYGLSEIIGPGVACECLESKDGPVIWEDHFYPEIVDPMTGAVLADGEQGELVLTSLTKQALPMIRYRTRDLTRLLPPTARAFRRMSRILGRSDDMLIIRGVNVFPTQLEEIVLQQGGLSPHCQIHVTREGALDQLELRCELQASGPNDQVAGEIAARLRQRIKDLVGLSIRVVALPPQSLERPQLGKARRVFDHRSKSLDKDR
jgi:phenylacetate-CoA ligase